MQTSCFYKSTKASPRLCRSFNLKMTGTSCTDDARELVPIFQKVTFFSTLYNIPQRVFVSLKMFLTGVIKDKHASNDLLQSVSSFLLRNNMKTNTTSSLIIEIQLNAYNLHMEFALFCTPYYLRHGIDIFSDYILIRGTFFMFV